MNAYNYDFATDTLTVSSAFLKAAGKFGSTEYKTMMSLKKDHPTMTIVEKTRKDCACASKKPHPTYAQMKAYINLFPADQAKDYLARLEKIEALSKFQRSAYNYVRDWFIDFFPNFNADALMDKDGNLDNLMTKYDIELRAQAQEMKEMLEAATQAETAATAAA